MTLTPESFAFCFRRSFGGKTNVSGWSRKENKNEEFFGSFFGIATQFIPSTRQWRIFLAAPDDCESGLFALTPERLFHEIASVFSYVATKHSLAARGKCVFVSEKPDGKISSFRLWLCELEEIKFPLASFPSGLARNKSGDGDDDHNGKSDNPIERLFWSARVVWLNVQ